MHSEHNLTPEQQLCQSHGGRVFEYIRDATMEGRPGALKTAGLSSLTTLAALRSKAEGIIAKREAKAAELLEDANGDDKESDDEAVIAMSAPKIGSIASAPPAAKKKTQTRKKADKDKEKEKGRQIQDDDIVSVSDRGSKGRGGREGLDSAEAEALRKKDQELHAVVVRLGYMPECFSNLSKDTMFSAKIGRSLYQA